MFRKFCCQHRATTLTSFRRRLATSRDESSRGGAAATDEASPAGKPTQPQPRKWRPLPPPASEAHRRLRDEFYRREAEWEAKVDFARLSDEDKVIHRFHREAVAGHIFRDCCVITVF
jgi:hypothetical protein